MCGNSLFFVPQESSRLRDAGEPHKYGLNEQQSTTYEQLFAAADRYAYQAKAGGRNRVVCGPLHTAA